METSSEVTSADPIVLDYHDPFARPIDPDRLSANPRKAVLNDSRLRSTTIHARPA